MKKIYAFTLMLACTLGLTINAQNVNNPGFETWENLGSETEEPTQWNSFMTAGGSLTWAAAQQLVRSEVVRPGAAGTYSALIWSRETFTIVANGNLTTGKINMANVSPSHVDNYNATVSADPLFSEAFTADPDSIVFWVKFVPASGTTDDTARMHAVIHDAYDYRDPSGSDVNGPAHVVADATGHFTKTNGLWVRKAVAFVPGPAATPAYMLLTFTTNKNPGGGSGGDSLYIDDVEFIYNGIGIQEAAVEGSFSVYADRNAGQLTARFNFNQEASTVVSIYNIAGQLLVQREKNLMNGTEVFDISSLNAGIYFMQVTRGDGTRLTKKFALR